MVIGYIIVVIGYILFVLFVLFAEQTETHTI